MTLKRDEYTIDDWRTLQFAAFWIFYLVAGATGGIEDKEYDSLGRSLFRGSTNKARLVREVFESITSDFEDLLRAVATYPRSPSEGLKEVAVILDAVASHDEALMFKAALVEITFGVAEADGEIGAIEEMAASAVMAVLGFDAVAFSEVAPAYEETAQ
jgi:tellurite resistance protein